MTPKKKQTVTRDRTRIVLLLLYMMEQPPKPQNQPEAQEENPKPEKHSFWDKAKKYVTRGVVMTTAATTIAGSAMAEGGNEGEKDSKSKTEVVAKKVNEVPPGFTDDGIKDGKHYYKKESGLTLQMAKPGSSNENPEQYKSWLIQKLQSGVTVQELVDKKYISADEAPSFEQYYKPSVERVYTEPTENQVEKKVDPYERWGGHRETIYGPNGHAVAELWYPTAYADAKDKSGTLNTQKVQALYRGRTDFGYIQGQETVVDASEFHDALGGVSNTFQSTERLQKFLKDKGIDQEDTVVLK